MKLEDAKHYLGQRRVQHTDDGDFVRECVALSGEIKIRADGEQAIDISQIWMNGRWDMETYTSPQKWEAMTPVGKSEKP